MYLRARDPSAPVVAEFRGKVNEVALAIEGTLGPLEALLQKRWPYPVNLQGEIAGRKAALATKLRAEDKLYTFDELRIAFGANALTGSLTALAGDPRPKLTFALSGPALLLNELPLPAAAAAPAPRRPRGHRGSFRTFRSTSRCCDWSTRKARSRSAG